MPMTYNKKKKIYEFGYDYINTFIKEKASSYSSWNETQLHLLLETLINSIDTIVEQFMLRKYIGSAVWILEQLNVISSYVQAQIQKNQFYIYTSPNMNDPALEKVSQPLDTYRMLSGQFEFQPRWLVEVDKILSQPHRLCVWMLTELDLTKFQTKKCYTQTQQIELHMLIKEVLAEAITTLKNSSIYRLAEQDNHLYYNIIDKIPFNRREHIDCSSVPIPNKKRKIKLLNNTSQQFFKNELNEPEEKQINVTDNSQLNITSNKRKKKVLEFKDNPLSPSVFSNHKK